MHPPHYLCACSSTEFPFISPACKVTKASSRGTQQSSVLTARPKLVTLVWITENTTWEEGTFSCEATHDWYFLSESDTTCSYHLGPYFEEFEALKNFFVHVISYYKRNFTGTCKMST